MTALGGGRWQCVQCGFQSKSTNVKYHIEAKHMTSSERYSCQYCHELFKTRISLNVHMTRKHREVPFPSNIPWNTFLNIATKLKEIENDIDILFEGMDEMMTSLGGGRWQCVQCGYQSKSTNVKYHIEAKHMTTSDRYECQQCQELFKTRISYNNHMQRKHREAPATNQSYVLWLCTCVHFIGDIDWSSLMTSLGGGKWQCLACGYQSKSTNVRYHIEAKHMTSDGYTCPYCQEVIRNRGAYNHHLSQKHRNDRWACTLLEI